MWRCVAIMSQTDLTLVNGVKAPKTAVYEEDAAQWDRFIRMGKFMTPQGPSPGLRCPALGPSSAQRSFVQGRPGVHTPPRWPQKTHFYDMCTWTWNGVWKLRMVRNKETWHKIELVLTLSPSSTSQSFSSVAGLKTGNFLPLTELCHSLFMKICREGEKEDKKGIYICSKFGGKFFFIINFKVSQNT